MVAFGTMESGSLDAEEGLFRVPRPLRPSDAPGARNVEDSLPAPKLSLHIAIEVIGHLSLAQETRSLSCEELSLIAFLLDQIFLLKEVVQQHRGMDPPLAVELLGQNQIASFECSKMSKVELGSSGDEVDSGASSPHVVVVEL
jgi:hypothetical protein